MSVNRKLVADKKSIDPRGSRVEEPSLMKNNQMNELFEKWVDADQRSKHLKEALGLHEVLTSAPKV